MIKVVWGWSWDELLARDVDGVLVQRMNATVDGEYQRLQVAPGSEIREMFFGPDPRLRRMVAHLSDRHLEKLPGAGTITRSCTRPTRRRRSRSVPPP